jgi:hypothetical protein
MRPSRISRVATKAAVSMPTAKQIPCAGVAGVQRRIGLDHARDQPSVRRTQRAAEAADDARSDGGLEAERVADRDRQLADAQRAAAAERGMLEPAAGQPQHREVGSRIVADQCRRNFAAVRQRRGQAGGAGDDVAVGKRVAVGREHDAGALSARAPVLPAHRDVQHGRRHTLHGRDNAGGIGVEVEVGAIEGHFCVLCRTQ